MKKRVLIFVLVCVVSCSSKKEELPYLGNHSYLEKDGKEVVQYYQIPNFRFMNQDSIWVEESLFQNKIYVADFFFTSCGTICPVMKNEMLRVYNAFLEDTTVLFLSHSIDPVHDNISILKEYANSIGVDGEKWHFVRGEKEDIYDIAEKYLTVVEEDTNGAGELVHSGLFLLIDRERHIRGFYDGTNSAEVTRLIEDIEVLLKK
ncbi:MAG: SCO family protein [Chitinophagaceae bacterium]|nr:SCO family protein [Chitinophagaceae bacterium]